MTQTKKGVKIEESEAEGLDPAKRTITGSKSAEVEGQELTRVLTECPWCGCLSESVVDTGRLNWYECGECGRPFRA